MIKEKNVKTQAFRDLLMKNMSEEERARFLRDMEIGDKIMQENYDVLKRLADS